nr:4'-phosphopantetheinyl transferase superfamily protein [uncultured Desulfobulbus sp.]
MLRLLQTYDPVRFGREKLTNLQQTSMGKPFLPAGPEFSISHSGEMVVVALAPEGKIGIDIEQMVELNVQDLRGFVPEIDRYDQGHEEGIRSFFYHHWTQREAVAKASGMGLLGPIETLVVDGDKALYDATTWSLQKIPLQQEGYVSHLALDTPHYSFTLGKADLMTLLAPEMMSLALENGR